MQVQSYSAATPSRQNLSRRQGMPMRVGLDVQEADTTTTTPSPPCSPPPATPHSQFFQPPSSMIHQSHIQPLLPRFPSSTSHSINRGFLPQLSQNNYFYPSVLHQSRRQISIHMGDFQPPQKMSTENRKKATNLPLEERTSTSAVLAVNQPTIACPVCGDGAINHFHYGGMCCYSCKAFFRRIVNSRKATRYKCRSGNNSCDISLVNRRSCQSCRYNKCLAAGMKPDYVLSDIQRQQRFRMRKRRSSKSPHNDNCFDNIHGSEDRLGEEHFTKNKETRNKLAEVMENNEFHPSMQTKDDIIKYKTMLEPTVSLSKNNLAKKQLFISLFCSSYSRPSNLKPQNCEGDRTLTGMSSGGREADTTTVSPPCSPPPATLPCSPPPATPPCSPPPATPRSQFFQPQSTESHLSPTPPLIPQGTSHLHQSLSHPILQEIPRNNHFVPPGLRLPPLSVPHHPGLTPVASTTRDYQPMFKSLAEKSNTDKLKTQSQSDPGSQAPTNNLKEKTITSRNITTNQPAIECPVCGDAAINHFHYGGMCCYSCKAFFRRIVNSRKATRYKCRSGNNSCDISLANRRSCQSCRYNKCLAAGMKPDYVLSEIQRQQRFRGRKEGSEKILNKIVSK